MPSSLPKAVRLLATELNRLPGIGPKTAQRLAIYLLRQPRPLTQKLSTAIKELHDHVYTCATCFNLAESEQCFICRDRARDTTILCVVEDPLDVEAIEKTGSYHGRYHVLGGVLSPLEGIGAGQLTMHELFARLSNQDIKEVIIALDHNIESDATTHHILSFLKNKPIRITRLARGLPTGGDIEFADAMTLNAAFEGRRQL